MGEQPARADQPATIRFDGADGVYIAADRYGEPTAPAVVFLYAKGCLPNSV
jgi:hypothetical protein